MQRNATILLWKGGVLPFILASHKLRCYFNEIPAKLITDHSDLIRYKGLSVRLEPCRLKLAEYVDIEHKDEKENVGWSSLSPYLLCLIIDRNVWKG